MSLAAVQQYIKSLLDQMPWPDTMTGLPAPNCYIQPPNPNVQSEIPSIYVWMQRDRESRDTDKLRSGTIPRAAAPGGPSGTKAVDYMIPVWLVWMMSSDDPDIDNLFPGMIWAVRTVLRGGAFAEDGTSYSQTPYLLTDPWTSEQSWLIDLGEDMTTENYERVLEDQRFLRFDAVIDCSVSEVIAS